MGAGRPPRGLRQVERLEGSTERKERLRAILATLTGEATIAEACAQVGVSAARFHALRAQVLEGALSALTPGQSGRPRQAATASPSRVEELERQVHELQIELQAARVRTELALALPQLLRKKKASPRTGRGPRRRDGGSSGT